MKSHEKEGEKVMAAARNDDDKAPVVKASVVLSSYGDEDQRRFPKTFSTSLMMFLYGIYIGASMLPLLILAFCAGVYWGLIPLGLIQFLTALVALDFAIPLPDPLKPNKDRKLLLERIFAEGSQHYYPARSIFLPTNLRQDRSYILAAWPHGLMGGGTHVGFSEFSSRGIFPLYSGASVMKSVPFVRRLFSIMGFTDVSKVGLSRVLDTKKNGPHYPYNVVHLVVGGIHEMFYTTRGDECEQIIIRKRKGFVKLAIQTGSDLIPMYTFGANQTYLRLFSKNSVFCKLSSIFQVSLVTWLGRWNLLMGFVPRKIPLLGVTGPIFEVPKVGHHDEITDELVEKTHAKFCDALKQLFDEYKVIYVEEMGADTSWLHMKLKFEDE